MRNRGCCQFITHCLCLSFLLRGMTPHTLPLPQRGVPPMGDSPLQTAPKWILPMGCSSSVTALALVPAWGAVSQEQAAPAWVPLRVTSPARKPVLGWAPLPTGPQVLPGACSSAGSPWGHSLLQTSTCSGTGSSMCCRWTSAPRWTSMGCRGTACLTMVFITGCRAITVPAPGASPPPPSSLTLVSAELFPSHILTPLSPCRFFFPFLNIFSQRHYHCCWLARPWPAAGPSWSWLVLALFDIGEASGSFSQKSPL